MMTIMVGKALATVSNSETLTAGMVGAKVKFTFSSDWTGYSKSAVFQADDVTKVIIENQWDDGECYIPHEVLGKSGEVLKVGVYGVKADKVTITPTIWASLGLVHEAVEPDEDDTTDPTLPVWAQLQADLDSRTKTRVVNITESTSDTFTADHTISEIYELIGDGWDVSCKYGDSYYTLDDVEAEPTSDAEKATKGITFRNTQGYVKTSPERINFIVSAFKFTWAGGVALTELDSVSTNDYYTKEETKQLKLPNPYALIFTGAATGRYDGSAALSIEIPEGGGGGGGGGTGTPEVAMFYATMEDYTDDETLTFDELPEGYSNAYTAMYDAHSTGKVVILDIYLSETKHFVLPLAEIDATTALFFGYYNSNLQVATMTETGETFTFISLDDLATLAEVKDYAAPHALTGSGAPTTSTVGVVGQMYVNTTDGSIYACTAVSGSTYTWKLKTWVTESQLNSGLATKQNASTAITTSNIGSQTVNKAKLATDNVATTSPGLRNQYFSPTGSTPTVDGQICWVYG